VLIHVVVLYVLILYISLPPTKVVLGKYVYSNLVYTMSYLRRFCGVRTRNISKKVNYFSTYYCKNNTLKNGSLQYYIYGLDILITVVGNEGYPTEGVAVFGLHGV